MKLIPILVCLSVSSVIYIESVSAANMAKLEINEPFVGSESQATVPFPKIDINKVFEIFLLAVDQGQLQVFDKTLSREILRPVQVEYVYTQEDPYPVVKVFSVLDEPLSLPSLPDIQIMGVIGVMDIDGNIIESIVHCDVD